MIDLPVYPEARLCYSNRNVNIDAVTLGSAITIPAGGADYCNFQCQEPANAGCVGFTYVVADFATGAGSCQLYSDLGKAERTITGDTNIYVANAAIGSDACPPLAPPV
jgi:hypothetical protein